MCYYNVIAAVFVFSVESILNHLLSGNSLLWQHYVQYLSLSQVTQPSGGSSESLQQAVPPLPLDPPAPLDTPRSGSPSVLRRTKLDPIKVW